jgi:UDPglucose--hexose-1-phosphate uridylyltransferase
MPQLRQDVVTGSWVVIAPERAKRPSDFHSASIQNDSQPSPFLVGGDAWKGRIKEADTTNTFTIQNLYPAFVCDEAQCETRSYFPEGSLFRAKPAVGDHEVIVIKDPTLNIFHFTEAIWHDLFASFQMRMLTMSRQTEVIHAMPIYNHGTEAGASIGHPHAQLFGTPIIPNRIQHELNGSETYFSNNGTNVFDDLIEHELRVKARVITSNADFIAITAYAARFPFEMWIIPLSQGAHFHRLTNRQRTNLAKIMKDVVGRLGRTLKNPSFNLWIHSSPTTYDEVRHYRWHIEIAPRVVGYGGFELGADTIIDIMSPEVAAEHLRQN